MKPRGNRDGRVLAARRGRAGQPGQAGRGAFTCARQVRRVTGEEILQRMRSRLRPVKLLTRSGLRFPETRIVGVCSREKLPNTNGRLAGCCSHSTRQTSPLLRPGRAGPGAADRFMREP